jgi:hypothetical protein
MNFSCVVELSAIKECSVLPWKRSSGFHSYCCRDTKYFLLLSTIATSMIVIMSQHMHNSLLYYILSPTCFGLTRPSSGRHRLPTSVD